MSINRFSLALNASENERYLVRKGVDMLAVLRALASRHQPLFLYFADKDDYVETELMGLNPAFEELVFSAGTDSTALERLLAAGSFGVETLLDSIRILFIATHAEVTQFKGQSALRARIPDTLARMQRRQAVRVTVPKDQPSYCVLRLSAEPLHELRLLVHDLSDGGLGLFLPASVTALTAGKTVHDCSLDLPGIGVMRCTLNIVYLTDTQLSGGENKIGCRFIDLPALSKVQLKSYVARLERVHLAAV